MEYSNRVSYTGEHDATAGNPVEVIQTDEGGFVGSLDALPAKYFRSPRFIGSYLAIALGMTASVSSFGLIAPQLAEINRDIGPNASYLWISYLYTACIAVGPPIIGRLSDIFGRRYWMIGGVTLGVVGAAVASRAQNIPTLIGANVLMGIASAAQYCFYMTVGELVPTKYRYIACSGINFLTIPGTFFGPIVSASMVQRFPESGWRSLYYLVLGIETLDLLLWVFFYFPPSFHQKHGNDDIIHWIKHFDYFGLFLLLSGLVLFLFGLSMGGTVYPWKSAGPITMIVLGFLLLCALMVWSSWNPTAEVLIQVDIIKNVPWLAAAILQGIASSGYFATSIVWPMLVAALYGNGNKTYEGWLNCLPAMGNNAGITLFGFVVFVLPQHKIQLIIGFAISTIIISCGALVNTHNKGFMIFVVFTGNFFAGWAEIITSIATGLLLKNQQDIGSAYGMATFLRATVTSVISVVFGTIVQTELADKVPSLVPPAVLQAGLPSSSVGLFLEALTSGSTSAFDQIPGVTPSIIQAGIQAFKKAYAQTFRMVFLVSIAFFGIGMILTLFTVDTRKYMNTKVAATLNMNEQEVGKPNNQKGSEVESSQVEHKE